ncbi:LysR family transcriptional regulator [soil metagenome]
MPYQFDLFDMGLVTYIAEGKSLTHAADRARISLPAVSTRIRNLEEGLGVKLLARTRQGVSLTEPGLKFLRHATQMLKQLENLRADMKEYAEGAKGSVRVCATTTAVTEFLPNVLGTYLSRNPDVKVDLSEKKGDETVSAVRDGSVDIGVISNTVYSEGLQVVPYRTLRLVLVTSANHELALRESVRFTETLSLDYVGLPDSSAYQHFLVEASTSLNRRLNLRVRVNNFEAACRMAELDIGVALLPESAARRNAETMQIRIVPLSDTWAIRQLLICVRNRESLAPFAQELVQLLIADGKASSPPSTIAV